MLYGRRMLSIYEVVIIAIGSIVIIIGCYYLIQSIIKVIRHHNAVKRKEIEGKQRLFVKENSKMLSEINSINTAYSFQEIPPALWYSYDCSSKREYDLVDYKEYMIDIIKDNIDHYQQLLMKIQYNKTLFSSYKDELWKVREIKKEEQDYYNQYPFFEQTESQMFGETVLKPVINLHVTISYHYITPKGQKSYNKSCYLETDEIQECYNEAIERKEHEKTAKYQREIMTPSLRYDVMKRDGFRCVLCGAEAKDGIKLHVDHIIPVSKGGKTEISNLRTLCDRCNMGKGAKYDPNGLN